MLKTVDLHELATKLGFEVRIRIDADEPVFDIWDVGSQVVSGLQIVSRYAGQAKRIATCSTVPECYAWLRGFQYCMRALPTAQ